MGENVRLALSPIKKLGRLKRRETNITSALRKDRSVFPAWQVHAARMPYPIVMVNFCFLF